MSREALVREINGLSKRELSVVLKRFAEEERAQLLALLTVDPEPPAVVPFATLAGLPPWLLKAIEPERNGPAKLTAATRGALRTALEAAASPQARSAPRASDTFIGRMLRARRQARAR